MSISETNVESTAPPQVACGLLERVDLVNRIVTVLRDEDALTFDVSPRCEILLNGERVKLRLLQPRDRVSLTYRHRQGALTALSLEASTRQPARFPRRDRETEIHQQPEEQA